MDKINPLLNAEDVSLGALDCRLPNFKRKFANIHYQSTTTGEFGTLFIRPNTTEDQVLEQYGRLFPRECAMFLQEVKDLGQALINPNGMSGMKTMSALTRMPELIYMAMKYFNEDFWADKRNVYRFIKKYPKFNPMGSRVNERKVR